MKQHSPAILGVLSIMLAVPVALAGDLNPPAGPIQPTDRTTLNAQSITLPYTITQPGSYVLTSNLTGVAGQSGIILESDDVTLDLNGFSLIGVPGSFDGIISAAATADRITIRNGTVREWGGDGIEGAGIVSEDWLIEDIMVIDNLANGMLLISGVVIKDCIASGNGSTGISAFGGNGTLVENCLAKNNGGDGIDAGGVVRGSAAINNGFHGILVIQGLVDGCVSRGNAQSGIQISGGSVINSTTSENGGNGIFATRSYVKNCTSISDNNGIRGLSSSRFESNMVIDAMFTSFSAGGTNNNVIMLGNTATGNAVVHYQLFSGNSAGPIVDVSGVTDISTIPAASHPWANFIH